MDPTKSWSGKKPFVPNDRRFSDGSKLPDNFISRPRTIEYVEHLIDAPVIVEDGGTKEGKSESEDADYEANTKEDKDSDSNISLDDSDYDENWDWTNARLDDTVTPEGSQHVVNDYLEGGVRAALASWDSEPTTVADFVNEDGDSEDLDSPGGSDEDEERKRKYPKFKMLEDGDLVRFELGQIFTSAPILRAAVKEYAMQQKKNVYLAKNDKRRIVVKCMIGCPFYLRASKSTHNTYYQVVSLENTHSCHRTAKNRQAKTKWLANKFMNKLKHTPNMKLKALIFEAKVNWGVVLTRFQAYRARIKAIEMIHGDILDQYKHLRSYGEELMRSNPNSIVVIKSNMGDKGPVFERMYVCFHACKAAFVSTCRPLIGLDGCFLKGVFGGQLLSAIGNDGNNQMIPIAFAIVEAETKDSWTWFLELLIDDLNKIERKKWAFISDEQKGLVPTLQSFDENVEHRLCVKHLYGNWRKKYPGDLMKEALWKAARASTIPEWTRAMEDIKKKSEQAWKDMMDIPPPMWTRAAYSTYTQCDLQVNNMCEAFNRAILEDRDKPIISLIEGLKFYMNERFVKQRDMMLRYRGNICPMIQQKLEKIKREADGWCPNWAGDEAYALFEVSNAQDKYVVNLVEKSCSCRRWDLSGIPCCHAIACMWFNNQIPEDFVNPCYRKSTFLSTYSHIILPSNGPKLWPISDAEPINPPYMRRAPGRPKKARRKTNDELRNPHKLRRQHTTIRCKRCGSLGHNVRTCKGKTTADRVIPRGGNKVKQAERGATRGHTCQGVKRKKTTDSVTTASVQTQATDAAPQPSQSSVQQVEIRARASSKGSRVNIEPTCGTSQSQCNK